MQTVLYWNRTNYYVYTDELESCATPNNLLFGRNLKQNSIHTSPVSYHPWDITEHNDNINAILDHFWDRWRWEYVVNLRETHRPLKSRWNLPKIKQGDIVLVHEEKIPRSMGRLGIVTELTKEKDTRGALVRIPKTNTVLKRKDESTCFIIIRKEFNLVQCPEGKILTLYPSTSPENTFARQK